MTAAAQLKTPAEAQDHARRVLVAEDNTVTNDLLRLLLSERGHQVDIVEDGEEALAALKKHHDEVVLMDFHLPKMDGAEVTSLYRSRQVAEPSPRFIAINSDMKDLLNNARDCETFDELLPKPLDPDSICKMIEGEATETSVSPPAPGANGCAPLPTRLQQHPAPPSFRPWAIIFCAGRMIAMELGFPHLACRPFSAMIISMPPSPAMRPRKPSNN